MFWVEKGGGGGENSGGLTHAGYGAAVKDTEAVLGREG